MIEHLEHDFRDKVKNFLLPSCQANGYILRPYSAIRDVYVQAKLWRQSRSTWQINKAIADLKNEGADFLSSVLKLVGPQYGRWATNALPGQSWHQHGLAVDCFLLIDGRAVWDSTHEGYYTYAKESIKLGLESGYFWRRRDAVHVQAFSGRVSHKFSWDELDELMKSKFEKGEVTC